MTTKEKGYTRKSWQQMRNRCNSPKNSRYEYYGGIGVDISADWENFENFYADMGPRPIDHDLKRRDPSLGYSKENCFWAKPGDRGRYRRKTVWITVVGITDTTRGWCARLNRHPSSVYYHMKKTGSMQTAVEFLVEQARQEGRDLVDRPT